MVGKRLGPERVDLEARRLHAAGLFRRRALEHGLHPAEHGQQSEKGPANDEIPLALHLGLLCTRCDVCCGLYRRVNWINTADCLLNIVGLRWN